MIDYSPAMIATLLRKLLSALIVLALVSAPVASAHAAFAMLPQSHPAAVTAPDAAAQDVAGTDGMSDCMKAMQKAPAKDCGCCDTKSQCPDGGACLVKCSNHVLAVATAPAAFGMGQRETVIPAEPQRPPDWSLRPPAPPPRA